MSDTSQGPDWWQATDGKWYPPGQHPGFRPPDPPGIEQRKRKQTTRIAIAMLAVAIVVTGVLIVVLSGDDGNSKAIAACHTAVKDRLRAPASARLDVDKSPSVEKASASFGGVSVAGANTLVVKGTVDSQNGFGALIRNAYTCTTDKSGSSATVFFDSDVDDLLSSLLSS